MRLGLNLGYQTAWSDAGRPPGAGAGGRPARLLGGVGGRGVRLRRAQRCWPGSPAQTERIDVGAAVMQIPARTPAMTAMTAATLDTLSGGRFRLGLGVSGPQVSEGWHGVRFAKPLARTREYVDIVRLALRRKPVEYDGEHYTLPLPDGPGKALKLGFHPPREHIPIYLAAVGPKNLELAGEIADGWLAVFFAPEFAAEQLAAVARRPGQGRQDARRASTSCRPCRSWSATTSRRAPSWSAGTPRSTSAAWAAGSRTSTTSSPSGWATATRPRGPGPVPGQAAARRGGRRAAGVHRPHLAARARWTGSPTGCAAYADAGVTTLSVTPVRRPTPESGVADAAHGRRGARTAPGSGNDAGIWRRSSSGSSQGLTEFLPVSLVRAPADHLGARSSTEDAGAVVHRGHPARHRGGRAVYFAKDIWRIIDGVVPRLWSTPRRARDARLPDGLVRHRRLDPDRRRRVRLQGPDPHRRRATCGWSRSC